MFYHKNLPPDDSGDELSFSGDEPQLLYLREQDLRCEGSVFTVAADVAVHPFHNRINPNKAESMALAFRASKQSAFLFHFFAGCKVCERDIKLRMIPFAFASEILELRTASVMGFPVLQSFSSLTGFIR